MITKLTIMLLLISSTILMGQTPLGFNYQGIAREADGTPISSKEIAIRVRILDGPQGATTFEEEHFLTTNDFGLFTTIIGQGNGNSTLNSVNWAGGHLWLQIELDPDDSGNYILMGSQQLMSVPYALFAQQSGGGLSAGSGIEIINNKIINIAPDRPVVLNASNNVTITGAYPNFTIAASNEDADADPNNEIQDLQLVGNNLKVTNNATATNIDLSTYLDNTDAQNLAHVLGVNNSAGNLKIINLANPTLAQDASTKNYVDVQINGLQGELDDTQIGAGLNTNGSYTADASTNYLAAATDLKDADEKLDAQIETNTSTILNLTNRLNNTYAFQASFTINETGGVNQKQVVLIENLDGFNQIASNEIIIGASGLYMILVDSERAGIEGSLTNVQIHINSTDYTIYVSGLDQNVGRTLMLNLTIGDSITLLTTTSGSQSHALTGVIGGYKISD